MSTKAGLERKLASDTGMGTLEFHWWSWWWFTFYYGTFHMLRSIPCSHHLAPSISSSPTWFHLNFTYSISLLQKRKRKRLV